MTRIWLEKQQRYGYTLKKRPFFERLAVWEEYNKAHGIEPEYVPIHPGDEKDAWMASMKGLAVRVLGAP